MKADREAEPDRVPGISGSPVLEGIYYQDSRRHWHGFSESFSVRSSFDVIIVGGGPAGLNAAIILARCMRRVLLFDDGRQRNRYSRALHGFLTRDEIPPLKLAELGRKECASYGVEIRHQTVTRLRNKAGGFEVLTKSGARFTAKKILLTTGLRDELPPFPDAEKYFGITMFHCPFCDGYEFAGKTWAVYSNNRAAAVENCLRYTSWTKKIILLAQDLSLPSPTRSRLLRNGIEIISKKVTALGGRNGVLKKIVFSDGSAIPVDALFFSGRSTQCADLHDLIGCRKTPKGIIVLNKLQQSSINGLYVAGDMAREMQLAVIAAGEGARAAVAIHLAMNKEERL